MSGKPLHKRGLVEELDHFRPISIGSKFYKVFEKAVSIRLTAFLESNKVLFDKQFGFVKGGSTMKAMNWIKLLKLLMKESFLL
ncbi:hypothetical protein J6590_103028, partial [Homalodisca vitripennis]